MTQTRALLGPLVELTTSLMGTGCDSQVGEGYTGEPLLTIRGKIVQDAKATEDLVPVLGFYDRSGHLNLLDGHLSGSYPAEFKFDVTEAPPEAVVAGYANSLVDLVPSEFLLAPRNHPSVCDDITIASQQYTPDSASTGPVVSGTEQMTICNVSGTVCVNSTYACTTTPCDTIATVGDASLRRPEFASQWWGGSWRSAALSSDPGTMATWQSYYDPNDINHFYGEVRVCNTGGLQFPSTVKNGDVQRCTSTAETADLSAAGLRPTLGVAWNPRIAYSKENIPDYRFDSVDTIPISRGYNLIETLFPTSAEVVVYANCEFDATRQGYNTYNAEFGTNYSPGTVLTNIAQASIADMIDALRACPPLDTLYHYRTVEKPSEKLWTLNLMSYSTGG